MKQKHLLKSLLLLIALIVGGSAWAQDNADVSYDFTGSDWKVNNGKLSNGTVSFSGSGSDNFKMNNGYFMMGKNGAYINFPAYTSAVEKIVVTGRSGASSSTKMNIYVGETAVSTETTGCTGANTYEIASDYQAAGTTYTLKVTSSHNAQVTKIEVYFASDAPSDNRAATTITIDDAGITNTNAFVGKSAGTLAATVKAGNDAIEGASVTWSTDDTDVATVDATTGAVTLVAAGTATITASYDGDETNYKPSTATYTLTVVAEDPNAVTLWSEDFTNFESNKTTYSYVLANGGTTTKLYSENLAGGESPELLVSKFNGSFKATIPLDNIEGNLTLTFKANNGNVAVSTTAENVTVTGIVVSGTSTMTLSGVTASMTSIDIVFTNTTTSNCRLDDIVLKGSKSSDQRVAIATINGLEPAEIAFDATGSFTLDATFASSDPTDYEVTLTSSDSDMLSIDGVEYVAGSTKGTVTVTVKVEPVDDTMYKSAEKSFTVNIYDPNAHDGSSVENAYTVAEAIEATPTTREVYISGIVSSFYNTSIVGDGSNYRYYISDDGTTGTQLLVYKGKGLNETTFTDADDLKVGDEVVIYGKLIMYGNAPEVASGNYIVSLNRPADTTPRITVADATVSVDAGEHDGTMDITYENLTISDREDFGIQFYDEDGNELNKTDEPAWIEVSVASQDPQVGDGYVVSYYMLENEGAERTAYFKVFATGGNDFVYSNLVTITQAKYVAPDEEVDPAQAGEGAFVKVTSADEITAGNYLIVYEGDESHDAVAFNGGLETLDKATNGINVTIIDGKILATTATVNAIFTIQPSGSIKSASGLYIGKTAYSNGLDTGESALSNTFEIDDEGVVITAEGGCTLRYNYASDQLRFRYYKSGQQAIQLYKYDATATITEAVAVSGVGYRTYCSTSNLDFSNTGLTAYKATIANNQVSFTEVTAVPAGQGVLLKGAEGSYNVPVIAEAAELEGNAFVGVTEETKVEEKGIFVLMNPEGGQGVGFYKTTADYFTVGAHTAYLPATAGEAPARTFIGFDFDNTTTAIEGIANVENRNGEVYNLQGQRVSKAQKGLYIVGGKKMLVK